LLDTASKFALFSVSGLKDKQLIKKQAYTKTETCKLYSRVFCILLPNFIKIHRYNFELYRFKVGAFFETCSSIIIMIPYKIRLSAELDSLTNYTAKNFS